MARIHRRIIQKRSSWPRWSWWCDHSPRARHPGVTNRVGLIKHRYTNKASGGDGIPVELFQILKMMLWKCCTQYARNLGKFRKPPAWKRSVFIPIPKKDNSKDCSNYHTVAVISHASKVMLKILKSGSNSLWTKNFQMFKLDLEKAEEPEIKLPTSLNLRQSKRIPVKYLLLLHWLRYSLWLCDHIKLWKIPKKMRI